MEWIIKNKDWLFSGIAVAVPLAIIGWLFTGQENKKIKQNQKGGKNSLNIQVGGNFKIGDDKNDK